MAAVQAYSKINAQGQWIERSESVNLNELFDRMTTAELEAYAQDGRLPHWFTNAIGATTTNSLGLNPRKDLPASRAWFRMR